jgi:hypothetical protein
MVALALVVLVGLVNAKWFTTGDASRRQQTARVAQNVAEMQAAIQRQQMTVQRQAAAMNDKIQRQVAEMNINELMDKVDAPRIPLPPTPSPPTPPAPSVAAVLKAESGGAVATIETSGAKSEEVDAELAAEAKAAVAAIAEDDESVGEAASAAGNSEEAEASTETAKSDDEKSASDESQEAAPATDKPVAEKPTADKPATTPAESPAAEAASPPESVAALRPGWVDDPPKRTGDTWREVVVTEEYADPNECYAAANVYLLIKTYEHLQMLVGNQSYVEELPTITFKWTHDVGRRKHISHDKGKTWAGRWSIEPHEGDGIGVDLHPPRGRPRGRRIPRNG